MHIMHIILIIYVGVVGVAQVHNSYNATGVEFNAKIKEVRKFIKRFVVSKDVIVFFSSISLKF